MTVIMVVHESLHQFNSPHANDGWCKPEESNIAEKKIVKQRVKIDFLRFAEDFYRANRTHLGMIAAAKHDLTKKKLVKNFLSKNIDRYVAYPVRLARFAKRGSASIKLHFVLRNQVPISPPFSPLSSRVTARFSIISNLASVPSLRSTPLSHAGVSFVRVSRVRYAANQKIVDRLSRPSRHSFRVGSSSGLAADSPRRGSAHPAGVSCSFSDEGPSANEAGGWARAGFNRAGRRIPRARARDNALAIQRTLRLQLFRIVRCFAVPAPREIRRGSLFLACSRGGNKKGTKSNPPRRKGRIGREITRQFEEE